MMLFYKDPIEPTSNIDKLKPCTRCGSHDYEVRYAVNKNGQSCFPFFCKACNARSPIIESKAYAQKLGFKLI